MNDSHSHALQSFARKMAILLMLRAATQWTTVWLFFWGVLVLAARVAGWQLNQWLIFGVLGFAPVAIIAAIRERRRLPEFAKVRASYDRLKSCGGVVMSEETADMSQWQSAIPAAGSPGLRWRGGRTWSLLAAGVVFAGISLLLPERFTAMAAHRPLEIGQLVETLQTEVTVLAEEKILEPEKSNELQRELTKLKEDSSGVDPNKTWEALDHIKSANNDAARQAAEEALNKMTALTQAEALAAALQAAAESGLGEDTATRAAQDLAAMLNSAKIQEGLLKGEIPPELLSSLDGLNKEQLEKLLKSLQFNKNNLNATMARLANLKLITPEMLAKCKGSGNCPNIDALAAFLCEGGTNCNSFSALAASYCRGGVNRGRGDAPMTWTDGSDENGAKFKEEALPPSTQVSDAQLVGVSRAAPDLSGGVVVEQGSLASANAGGGSAQSQVVLPRHRQSVQRFFKREGN